MSLFASLPWNDGQINPSGIKTTIYWIPKSQLARPLPKVNPAPVTPAENTSLSGDFEPTGANKWKKLYTTQGKGKVFFEPVGEKDHKMFLNKGTFSFPDISPEALSLAKQTINSNIVMVVPMPHETEKRFVVLGDEDYDVTVSTKGDSGDAPGSAKGLIIEIEVPSSTPLPYYKGILELEDGTLDCETGVFTPSAS
ncbi:MAG: hypothetical protein FD170_3363 [Bacteroidetes bacterium]|jgi:hypothetical protein|nr:MAG: hypothetical protein FD170_3363 [Bacteroidota bacterium]